MARPKKQRKPEVKIKLIRRDEKVPRDPYALMDDLIASNHSDLRDARIALAWATGWRPDPEGHLRLGQARKAAEVDRQLHDHDLVILLNPNAWTRVDWTDRQRAAILDHELCHFAAKRDKKSGEIVEDEKGRTVYRIVKHDIEEFQAVVRRHGCWHGQLELMAKTAMQRADAPLLEPQHEEVPA